MDPKYDITSEKYTLPPMINTENSSKISSNSITSASSNGTFMKPPKRVYARSQSLAALENEKYDYSPMEIHRIRDRLLRSRAPRGTSMRDFTRQQKLTLTSLALVDFMSFCSMSLMAPFFPKEGELKGMTSIETGFVFSFYALVMVVSAPIFGKILPRVGAKFLFLSGVLLAGIGNIIFGLLEKVDTPVLFKTFCFIIRGIEALGSSAYSTASYVFVVNTFPLNIGGVLGIMETFVGLGMCTGPAIGGLLYSLGGFGLPFYILGIIKIFVVPVNLLLLPSDEDCKISTKSGSILDLLKVPSVLVTGLVVVVTSNIWGFLDPTLEPHLRKYDLTSEKVGLIFLLFSGLYGLSSPAWGYLADKCNNHWSMMVWGLLFCSLGLFLLGPSPLLYFIPGSLWLDLGGLSIIGVSIGLTLIPTFQRVLTSAIEGGCPDSITTCSLVAGIWSCMYALGEVLGPAVGGFLLGSTNFPMTATVQAFMTLILAVLVFIYFTLKTSCASNSENVSDSGISDSWKNSTSEDETDSESKPLLTKKGARNVMYTVDNERGSTASNSYGLFYNSDNIDKNPHTNIRKMIGYTGLGSCEI